MPGTDDFKVQDPHAEEVLRKIGNMLREVCPDGYGFVFLLSQFDGPNLFYTSSANRQDVVKMLREFIQKFGEN